MDEFEIDRRTFIATGAVAAASLFLDPVSVGAEDPKDTRTSAVMRAVVLSVNGSDHAIQVDTRMTLLDALRDKVGLTGSKKGCDQGQCGACTVLVDGRRVLSCLTLAAAVKDRAITTIEGLAQDGELHPMQAAFIECDAFQCGYCTPGQILSAVAMLEEAAGGELSDAEIRERLSGNICRCGAYPNIVAAVRHAEASR